MEIIEKNTNINNKKNLKVSSNKDIENKNIKNERNINLEKNKNKYNKNKDEITKNISHLLIKDNKKIWKYSLSSFNKTSNTGYYYCSDTSCSGKGTYKFELNESNEFSNNKSNKDNFSISKKHNIPYDNHNYIINEKTV